MPTLLIIDDDAAARDDVRAAIPPEWTLLEADDGLSGVDQVRRRHRDLDLVILDLHLPDLEGGSVYLRLRELRADLPIVPFTADPIPVAALNAMGCLPPIYKPVDVLSLRTQLYAVLQQPMPALRNDAVVSLAREQSHELEQLRRLQRSMLHIIIYGASRVLSSGLKQHLRGVAQMMEAAHPSALRLALEQLRWTAIIAEVSAASAIAPIARANQVPLVLLAFDPAQVRAAHTAGVATVLLAHDPALSERLAATLSAIALGEPAPLFPPPNVTETDNRPDVPPTIVDHFTALEISPREIDVIWLSAQGLDNEAIAQALSITLTTVNSHWRNIGAPRSLTRKQARVWAREEVRRVRGAQASE
jgi:DNA-binding NarL/FixJ family response regulator